MFRICGKIVAAVCLVVLMLLPAVGEGHSDSRVLRTDIQLVVQVAASGLSGQVAAVETREDQIALIRDFVKSARFFPNEEGYFFVYDLEGVCIAHGVQPELVGRLLIDFKDKSGLAVIKAIVTIGKAGGGYVEYLWPKPGVPGTFDKLGYVQPIPGTDFIIGSGLYFVDLK